MGVVEFAAGVPDPDGEFFLGQSFHAGTGDAINQSKSTLSIIPSVRLTEKSWLPSVDDQR